MIKWYGDKVTKKLEDALSKRLRAAIEEVAAKTRGELPKDTGRLASSVETKHSKLSSSWGSDLDYASDVEFGTREQSPDGTWRRVAHQSKRDIVQKLTGK